MATIIYSNGTETEVSPANGTDFKLEELQKIVGGYIEVLNLNDGRIMVVNEEGKIQGLDLNVIATYIYGRHTDCVVGNVLVCKSDEVR